MPSLIPRQVKAVIVRSLSIGHYFDENNNWRWNFVITLYLQYNGNHPNTCLILHRWINYAVILKSIA